MTAPAPERPLQWTLHLPYATPPLSLNDRGQTPGARKAKAAKAAMIRADVKTLARAAGIPPQLAIHVRLHYRPKTPARRDADNLVATLKPAIDGLRDAKVIPDDDPKHIDWSAPRIHDPSLPDRTPSLWLVISVPQLAVDVANHGICPGRRLLTPDEIAAICSAEAGTDGAE